jgi:hypothetical protein
MKMNEENIESIEAKLYDCNPFPNKPADFRHRSYTARREWVLNEMAHGDFEREKKLGAEEVIFFCCTYGPSSPLHFMFRSLLQRFEPEEVARHVKINLHAISFFQVFGLERSKPFVSSEIWLTVFSHNALMKPDKVALDGIRRLIQSRGDEQIAKFIKNKEQSAIFIEIFGFNSFSLQLPELAKQVKGQLLEDALGI